MRKKENIEKFVRVGKPRVTTSRQMDKRTLDDSFAVMERTIRTKSADRKPRAPGIIMRGRMIKLTAAAAVIIVGISLLAIFVHQGPGEQPVPKVVKSPTEMLTVASLNIAYRKGGLEAVEAQFEKAFYKRKPQPTTISVQELLEDFNG